MSNMSTEIEAHPSPWLWREKVAALSKTMILGDGIPPWEDRTGSKSTWIWLPSRSCCAKPVARSCYHNDTLVGPVRSRTPLGTSPVSNNPKTQCWLFDLFCGPWCVCVCRLYVVLFKVLVKKKKKRARVTGMYTCLFLSGYTHGERNMPRPQCSLWKAQTRLVDAELDTITSKTSPHAHQPAPLI